MSDGLLVSVVSAQPQPGCQGPAQGPAQAGLQGQHWYGSEEFLALPAQLRKTEMLALKLESLAHSMPLVSESQGVLQRTMLLVHSHHRLFFFYPPPAETWQLHLCPGGSAGRGRLGSDGAEPRLGPGGRGRLLAASTGGTSPPYRFDFKATVCDI